MRAHAIPPRSPSPRRIPLTGLLNRRGFFRELARAIAYRARYGTPIGLLLADLDGFKAINDRHGHEAGDGPSCMSRRSCGNNVRASDSVGRLGGDEFAVILWQVDEESARQKARSLEAMIAASPRSRAAGHAPPSAPRSARRCCEPDDTAEEALARADRAMYRRKRSAGGGPGQPQAMMSGVSWSSSA